MTLYEEVAQLALEQARIALRTMPEDAAPNYRANVITTAVRAITAWRELFPDPIHPEHEEATSPA